MNEFHLCHRSATADAGDAIARVDYAQQTDRKGLARNHRQMQRSREHVWIRDGQLGGLAIAANTPIAREMARIDREAIEHRFDARHAVGRERRLARQQDFQVRRTQSQVPPRNAMRPGHHPATLGHDVVDDDVDQSVAAHLVGRLADGIAAGTYWIA